MEDLDHVSGGVDARVGSPELLVYLEAAGGSYRDSSGLRERGLRTDADGQEHDARVDDPAVAELGLACSSAYGLETEAGQDSDSVLLELGRYHGSELGIHHRHDPRLKLHDGSREPPFPEGLGHLETDEAAPSYQGRGGRMRLDIGLDPIDVGNRPELEYVGRIEARQGGRQRLAALGKDEPVIGQPGFAFGADDPDALRPSVDLHGLGIDENLDSVSRVEALGSLEKELGTLGNCAGHIIRKTAIREGYVGPSLDQADLGLFRQAPRAGGRRSPAGDAAYYH